TVEFGADRGVDLLAAQLDDDSAENVRVDRSVDRDIAAGAGTELGLERRKLGVVEGPGRDDFGGRFAALLGRERAEGSDHVAKLTLTAIAGQDAEEIRGDRVELKLRGQSRERLSGLLAADQWACDQLRKFPGIEQDLAEAIEAVADGFDLPTVAGKVE